MHYPGNCFINEGFINSQGNNLESGNTCGFNQPTDRVNTDPLLAPLQKNGSFTLTHALLDGSPAIDAGNNNGCPAADQRGLPRPVDGNLDGTAVCDIGAYERQTVSSTVTATSTVPFPTETFTPAPQNPTATSTSAPAVTSTPASPTPTPPPATPCITSGALLALLALLFRRFAFHAL